VVELYFAEHDNPLRLQGQYYDPEIGMCYNLNRYYHPQLGCFVSQDPVRLAGGLNIYAYAPNVWTWVDPLGLACEEVERGMAAVQKDLDDFAGSIGHAKRSMAAQPSHASHWNKLKRKIGALIRREGQEAVPDEAAIAEMGEMIAHVDEILGG
jgi:RHS repeat-associated protein